MGRNGLGYMGMHHAVRPTGQVALPAPAIMIPARVVLECIKQFPNPTLAACPMPLVAPVTHPVV